MNGHYGQHNGHYYGQQYGQQYGQHYSQPYYGYTGREDPEEMVELNAAYPGYRNPNGLDFHFHDVSPSIPSPRPVMPFRPGHMVRDDYGSSGWVQPTPRLSAGPDSLTNTPYDSRSASPTLVSPNCFRSLWRSDC